MEHGEDPSKLSNVRRDPQRTSCDGYPLLEYLHQRNLPVTLASLNYRLSPAARHPDHQQDVITALKYLVATYGMKEFLLVGHSAGACLAFQVGHVLGCKGIIGAEGIYDLPELLEEYPEYRDIVEGAFGVDKVVWKEASPTNMVQHLSNSTVQLIQSKEDELLSHRQTDLMQSILQKASMTGRDIAWIHGTHDGAITNEEFYTTVHNFIEQLLDL